MTLDKTCKDIKSLKIQGAINVVKASTEAFYYYSKDLKSDSAVSALRDLKKAAKKLVATRSTEPALRNALAYYFYNLNMFSLKNMMIHLELKYHEIMNHFLDSEKIIIEFASKKIKNGDVVYTHCHSSTVIKILITAKKSGINFEVHNTETRPLYQGRKTAEELAKAGIKVTHYVDSAGRHALKKADIVFFGVDAITTTKIYNKIGTETFAQIASEHDIPVYFCTDSWKFDPKSIFGFDEEIEKRIKTEVWDKPPKNVKIYNYAFDMINPKFSTGIISELGVFTHDMFIEEAKQKLHSIEFF